MTHLRPTATVRSVWGVATIAALLALGLNQASLAWRFNLSIADVMIIPLLFLVVLSGRLSIPPLVVVFSVVVLVSVVFSATVWTPLLFGVAISDALIFWLVVKLSVARSHELDGRAESETLSLAVRDMILIMVLGGFSLSLNNARMFWLFLGIGLALVAARQRLGAK